MIRFTEFNSTGIATKTLTVVDGRLESDKRPNLTSGIGRIVELELSHFPSYLATLQSTQAISTGIPLAECTKFRFSTARKMLNAYGVTSFNDDAGWQLARVADQFKHAEDNGLMCFDYDPSDFADAHQRFETPAEFVAFLSTIEPLFKDAAYVAKYSTSANVYFNGGRLTKESGFHVYFAVKLGARTQKEINDYLFEKAWLAGFGYIAVSSSGALLTRVPFDITVGQTNRVMYEAPAVLDTEGMSQNNPAWYVGGVDKVDLSKVAKPQSNTRTRERYAEVERLIAAAKSTPEIVSQVRDVKTLKINDLMRTRGYTEKQAEKSIDLTLSGILDLEHVLYFDDGRTPTVLEVMANYVEYDGATLADPLEPEKGPTKAQFYANELGVHPVIHTFVRGEGNYYLNDAYTSIQMVKECDQLNEFKAQGWPTLECGQDADQPYFNFELPDSKFICLVGDMGTGKTQLVKRWGDTEDLGRILALAPKIALVMDTAGRLGVPAYSDDEIQGSNALLANGIATTLDSVYKFANYPVDTLFLDEFEQTIAHITASTLKNKRSVLATLKTLFQSAKRVIVADADLSPVTIQFLIQWGIIPNVTPTVLFNHHKACEGGRINMIDTEAVLKQKVLEKVKAGEGMYIANNKRGGIHQIARAILAVVGPEQTGYKYQNGDFLVPLANGQRLVIVTKDNSGLPEVGQFTKNINAELKSSDILITSPSLSTGVSINILHGLPLLKNRFLVCSSLVGTKSSDSVQQLERIRGGQNCETFVFVDHARHKLPTDTNLIITQELHAGMIEFCRGSDLVVAYETFYNCEKSDYNDLDILFELIYGYVKSRANLDRNHFATQLRDRLARKGYILTDVVETLESETKAVLKTVRVDHLEYERDLMVNAPLLNQEQERELLEKRFHTPEEHAMVTKTHFAQLLGERSQEIMDEVAALPKAQQRTLQEGMLLGVSPLRCAELDFATIARKRCSPSHVEGLYERSQLARDLLALVGVFFGSDELPTIVPKTILPTDLPEIYSMVRDFDTDESRPGYSRIKALLGVSVPYTDDQREIGKALGNVYRRCGIIFKKSTMRDPLDKKSVIHIRSVDGDWLDFLRDRITHARANSVHAWFDSLVDAPYELVQYMHLLNAGCPEQAPNIHNIFSKLNEPYQKMFNEVIHKSRVRPVAVND